MSMFFNQRYAKSFKKNDCPEDMGTDVLFEVEEARFVSTVSQEDADNKAVEYAETAGQDYANKFGGCCDVYYNEELSGEFRRCDCPEGEAQDEPVTHTVPAGTVVSLYSTEDANFWARRQLVQEGNEKAASEGICSPLYYSERVQGWYSRECPDGWKSEEKFFSFKEGHSISFVSVEDATEKAKEELDVFAQEEVNICLECHPVVGTKDLYHFD